MDLPTFRKLCRERASGKTTELQFWREMMTSFETHQPGSEQGAREKEVLLRRLKKHIALISAREEQEKNSLAQEVEVWLSNPHG